MEWCGRKSAAATRFQTGPRICWPPEHTCSHAWLERLEHHEKDNADHHYRRHFVPTAIEACRPRVAILGECRAPEAVEVVHQREAEDERHLHLPPTGMPPLTLPGEQQAEHPDQDRRRVHDAVHQAALHHLEGLALHRALLGISVIDEQARQVEQPGHPRDHRDDVQSLQHVVEHQASSAARTRLARPWMNSGCVPTVGTRTYLGTPASLASLR